MMLLGDLLKKPPSFGDIAYFVRAIVTRPGDIPGILRREASRRKSGAGTPPPADPIGARCMTESWEAALRADVFTAPPGDGPALTIAAPLDEPLRMIGEIQRASAVAFEGVEAAPLFPVLSLEAARLSLSQTASDPETARAARRAYIDDAEISEPLREALRVLADQPIGSL